MTRYMRYVVNTTFILLYCANALAQFPYQNTVTSGNDFSRFKSSSTTGAVTFTKDGAVITNTASQTHGFYLGDLAFTVDRGFIIGFDYLMTGGGTGDFGFGDGLALVLFDGSVADPSMGAQGAGLGYAYTTYNSGGLSSGFLGIGIDLWGNFKFRRTDSNDYRNGILNGSTNSTLIDLVGNKAAEAKNHITIRGQGDSGKGYPVLITQSVENKESRTMLDFVTGKYSIKPVDPDPNNKNFTFNLRENIKKDDSDIAATFGNPSYRRVQVSMYPGKNKENIEGYYMNVEIIHGSVTSRVIRDYFLPNNVKVNFMEATSSSSNTLKDLTLKAPTTFKLGFTAATGGANQKHIVRNLSIYMPFSPSIKDLYLTDICKDTPTEIDILGNAVGFDTNVYIGNGDIHQLGKRELLDPYSFQFRTIVKDVYEDTAQPYIAVTSAGTYEFNPKTMKAIFTPNKTADLSKPDYVYFTIRNKEKVLENNVNLGSEQFRSNTGTVRLTFGVNCNEILMVNGNSI